MSRRRVFSLVVLFAVFTASLAAQNAAPVFPRLEASAEAVRYGGEAASDTAGVDTLSWQEAGAIALWASLEETADAPKAADYQAKLEALAGELVSGLPEDLRERAEYVLTWMHEHCLSRYAAQQSRIDTLLDNGRYNCVSSAVLYAVLARSAGITVSGVATRDHAFATVHIPGSEGAVEDIDVETTNKFGFDPGSRTEFHDQFGNTTGFA
jgi:transglutaminase-like putative cysteine protease